MNPKICFSNWNGYDSSNKIINKIKIKNVNNTIDK